jgi:hypothetical protein
MKGFRTIGIGLALAIAPVALQYLIGIDWSQYVAPQYVAVVSGALMILMRLVTTTPPGAKN